MMPRWTVVVLVYAALVLDNILLTVVGEISFNPALSVETKRGFFPSPTDPGLIEIASKGS